MGDRYKFAFQATMLLVSASAWWWTGHSYALQQESVGCCLLGIISTGLLLVSNFVEG